MLRKIISLPDHGRRGKSNEPIINHISVAATISRKITPGLTLASDWLRILRGLIDHFSLYVLFFRPRDASLGNNFFQMSSNVRANVHITYEKGKKQKENSHENITWSGMGKQNL